MDDKATDRSAGKTLAARAFRRLRTLAITLLFAALAIGAVLLASDRISARGGDEPAAASAPPLSVETARLTIDDTYEVPQQFVGRVEPARRSVLGFEFGGTIEALLFEEGDPVTSGQVLARLDTRLLDAQLRQQHAARAALVAQLDLAKLTQQRQEALADRNFASRQRADETRFGVSELEARIAEADAAILATEIQLDKSEIRAPYDGEIGERYIDEGARIGAAAPVFEVLEAGALRVRVGLTPQMAARIDPDTPIRISVNGAPATARLITRRSDIDPVTRTQPLLFALTGDVPPLVFGQVVQLELTRTVQARGAWVPLRALSEGPRGLWTIYLVPEDSDPPRAIRESVEVLYADERRAYVRGGLPDGARIVTDGPHRLAAGQPVRLTSGG